MEMKFVSRATKYMWQGYKTNKDILSQLKINPVVKNIQNYRNKWTQHVLRWTETDRQTGTPNYEMLTVGERGKWRPPKMTRTGHEASYTMMKMMLIHSN